MTALPDVVEIHRDLVETRSISGEEAELATKVEGWLRQAGASVDRLGDNVIARTGSCGPRLLFNSHLDTVPPDPAWTQDPWRVQRSGDKIAGLGANDAKASVAAMLAAFLRARAEGAPLQLAVMFVAQEETGGKGTEAAWPWLKGEGWIPDGVVVGEPTGLDIGTSQRGLLLAEIAIPGDACHAANAAAMGAVNPVWGLARALVELEGIDLGLPHPDLGPATLQPTVLRGAQAHNQVPGEAVCVLDVRTVPGLEHEEVMARLRDRLGDRVRARSLRLAPYACDPNAAIVRAAQAARPAAQCFGSRTMSDQVFFQGVPAIKAGPGQTARSHRPDEFVLESELHDGVDFYQKVIHEFATVG